MENIQERVRARRKKLGMTQRDLAKRLGWTEPTLSRRLQDPERMRLVELRELAAELGTSPAGLLRGDVTLRDLRSLEAVAS